MTARGPGSDPIPNEPDISNGTAQQRLQSFVDRQERLLEDRAAVMADLKELRAEAKGEGYDTKIINKLVSLRAKNKAKLQEENALLLLYARGIGCEDLI